MVDPLAGSYYVESLTDEIERNTFKILDEIDQLGGAIQAIENDFQNTEIANSAYEYQQEVEKNEKIIVGLNKFKEKNEDKNNSLIIDEKAVENQLERLKNFKNSRDNQLVNKSLDKLKLNLKNNKNLMPYILYCVKNNCTLGEICDILREIYGEHK